jgi:uncharacterized protein HemX
MDPTDITKKLDELIKQVVERNKKTQDKKQEGPAGWVMSVILALISLVGIGVAMYLAYKQSKALAAAQTKIEQAKVDQDQQAHRVKLEPLQVMKLALTEQLKKRELEIQKSQEALRKAEQEHAERKQRIEKLNAWAEINEA